MSKTVEELIAERKERWLEVYEKSTSLNVTSSAVCMSFAIKKPISAIWSIRVYHYYRTLSVEFSIEDVPDVKMISSNFRFSFSVANSQLSACALSSTKVKTEVNEEKVKKYLNNSNDTFRDVPFILKIYYVGHPRMKNKLYDPNGFTVVPILKGMLVNPVLADFKFIVKGKEFSIHKSLMAAASPMLLKMFTTDMTENNVGESKIEHIEPEVFDAMLKFIYKTEIPEEVDRRDLYTAAHYFEIEALKELCEQEVHTSLVVGNALELFFWAYPYEELENLKYDAWDVIKVQPLSRLNGDDFETANFEAIKAILEKVRNLKQTITEFL